MAQKNYNVTGNERKALVNKVAELTGDNPVYLGMPTVSFKVGAFEISRTGILTWEDWADESARKLVEDLRVAGFWAEGDEKLALQSAPTQPENPNAENVPESEGRNNETDETTKVQEEESMQEETKTHDESAPTAFEGPVNHETPKETISEKPVENLSVELKEDSDTEQTPEPIIPHDLAISLPDNLSDKQFSFLQQLVQGKETLLKHAFQTDSVEILREDGKLTFPWFTITEDNQTEAYAAFLTKLIKFAKKAKRVTVKDQAVENEKYAFRCFLIRIGFVGKEYKEARHILLENLSGNTAWKNGKKEEE